MTCPELQPSIIKLINQIQSRSLHNPGKNNSPWTIKVGCAVPLQSLPHVSQLFQCSQEANWSNMGKEHFVPWLETARLLQSPFQERDRFLEIHYSAAQIWGWRQSRLIAPSFSKSSPSHRSPELNHNLQKSDPNCTNETPKNQLQTNMASTSFNIVSDTVSSTFWVLKMGDQKMKRYEKVVSKIISQKNRFLPVAACSQL